VNLHFVVLSVT